MDILIKNMEMPKNMNEPLKLNLVIFANGSVWQHSGGKYSDAKAIVLPKHGDLIERKYVYDASKDKKYPILGQACILSVAENAPTVLEATT